MKAVIEADRGYPNLLNWIKNKLGMFGQVNEKQQREINSSLNLALRNVAREDIINDEPEPKSLDAGLLARLKVSLDSMSQTTAMFDALIERNSKGESHGL